MPDQVTIRRIIHVSRHPVGESIRGARAIKKLNGVVLLGICERAPGADVSNVFDDLVFVEDTHDAKQLIAAARDLVKKHGPLEQIVTAQETLLEPVAVATETLGLRGMSVATVRRTLDKSSLKRILGQAGINTANDKLITRKTDARDFVTEVGFPIVLKPLNGSGGLATWCIRNAEQLELALDLVEPSTGNAFLAEDYLHGQELSIDTITVANEPRFHSICCYRPSILQALEDSNIQWTSLMPREIEGDAFRDFIRQGLEAVRKLEVGNAMTHMEGFLLKDGGLSFTDATLRPAGARIAPMLAYAYDLDPYLSWARVVLDGCFDGPWERKYAVGTVFLRGLGSGLVKEVHGMESVEAQYGGILVDTRMPGIGTRKSVTYTGDGYITVRHPQTQVVEDALDFMSRTVRITYSDSELRLSSDVSENVLWKERMQYFDKELNKPAWENEILPAMGDR